ncbi:MAG: NAD(+)/NADH kinase [Candidatus Syntropharchaeia archaeon]
MRIGIVSREDEACVRMGEKIVKILEGRAEIVCGDVREMDVDLIICIGGDGTILRTLQSMHHPIPLLGIDMGAVGFLASVTPEDAPRVVEKILHGFEVEERSRLSVRVNEEELPFAMNEAVVITSMPAKMLHFTIYIDRKEAETLRADGVVFATPTGSTAYAMSAGGPIVDPRIDACVIVPLAPFKLSARPAVVSADSRISLKLLQSGKEATLVIDGQFTRTIKRDDVVLITRGKKALFVKTGDDFFSRVRSKLAL